MDNFTNWNEFLYNYLNRNSDFPWNYLDSLDFDRFNLLVVGSYDFINMHCFRDLSNNLNDVLDPQLMCNNSFLNVIYSNQLIDYSIYWFLNFNVNIPNNLNLVNFLLNDRNLHLSLNLSNNDLLNYSLHYFLYYLRYLYYLLNYPRNYNNPLYDSLNLYYFRHLNDFFYDFINFNSYFFDPFDISRDLNDLLLNVFHRFRNLDVMIDYLFYLNDFRLVNNHRISKINLLNNSVFNPLDDRFFNYFLHSLDNFMNNRDLYDALNLNWNLSHNLNDLLDNDFNRLNDLFSYQLFSDNLDLFYSFPFDNYFNNFFDNLGYLHNALNGPKDRNDFLYDSIHWFVYCFDMIVDFQRLPVFDNWNSYLNDSFNVLNPWNLNDSLDNFFFDDLNFHNFLYDGLNWDYLLSVYFDFLWLLLDMIDDSLNLNYSLHLNYLLHNRWYLDDTNYLSNHFYYPLNNGWHLHNSLGDLLNRNDLIHDLSLNYWNLKRNVHYPLHLHYFLHLNNLFYFLCNRNYNGYLNTPFDDLLNNLLHLNNFRHRSEHFENIVNINDSHNLRRDHPKDSFIHLKHNTRFVFYLMKLLQQSLN